MNAISCRCRTINRGYNRAVINILKFDTHLVVGCAIAAGDVAANHSLAIAFEKSYTLTEFSNEDQEFHDVRNVFNAQMQALAIFVSRGSRNFV